MFAIVCPHCAASLDVEPRGIGQPSDCPNCGGAVLLEAPAAQQQTITYQAPAPPPTLLPATRHPPPVAEARRSLLIGGCSCLLVIVLGLPVVLGLAWLGAEKASSQRAADDPWPECAAVRKWLATHANDAGSVEIVAWERRFHNPYDGPTGQTIRVRFRARNERGALVIRRHFFAFRDGKMVREYPESP